MLLKSYRVKDFPLDIQENFIFKKLFLIKVFKIVSLLS